MCGIVGYVGNKSSLPVLLEGLRMLEYRGYDSAGVSLAYERDMITVKSKGKLCELEKKYPELTIKLELCLPCRNQTDGWGEQDKAVYNFVLSRADKVTYEQDTYTAGCMHARNRRLVDGADACVTYLASSSGGTAYTCNYARENGVRLINLLNML